jgi:hypothetical protein
MSANLLIRLVALGLAMGVGSAAHAQHYFSCDYAPRCEAVQNKQCAPGRTLKDKISLIRLHNSAEDVERTWAVLASFEPEYCSRLGDRGNIVRDFLSFRAKAEAKPDLKPSAGGCTGPLACAEVFVSTARERWQREDLDARIKADLERSTSAAGKTAQPAPAASAATEQIPPGSWQTTTKAAPPAKGAMPIKAAAPAKSALPAKTRTVQSE